MNGRDPADEETVKRAVVSVDPAAVLPVPGPLAAPILFEPVPAPVLTTPMLWEDPGTRIPAPALSAPVLEEDAPAVPQTSGAPAPAAVVARRRGPAVELGVLTAAVVLVVAVSTGQTWLAAIVALIACGCAGLAVLAYQPVLVFCAMGLFLGAAPGVQTPVLGVSVAFVLSAALWVALAVMPEVQHRVNWAAGLSAVLIGLAAFAFFGNPITSASISDFVRWSVTVAAVYPLSVMPSAYLARTGRWFVYGCTAAAVFGIALVVVDRDGSRLSKLTIFGYSADGGNGRFVFGANGNVARLTSTYVDPNLGGFLMAVGLILGLALLRGRARIVCSGLLTVAIALTLGRADIGSIVVAGVLLVLFSGISPRIRGRLFTLGAVAGIALLAVPAVRTRLANSFSTNDRGSSARWEAFGIFPSQMSGHWLFGRGFGAPELVSANAAAATNYVANAPLLTVYRGGVVVGIAFTVLMLTAGLTAWRLMRRSSFEAAALGAGYLGIMVVALQLDFPVVTLSPATLAFALLLAFLGRPDAFVDPDPEPAEDLDG